MLDLTDNAIGSVGAVAIALALSGPCARARVLRACAAIAPGVDLHEQERVTARAAHASSPSHLSAPSYPPCPSHAPVLTRTRAPSHPRLTEPRTRDADPHHLTEAHEGWTAPPQSPHASTPSIPGGGRPPQPAALPAAVPVGEDGRGPASAGCDLFAGTPFSVCAADASRVCGPPRQTEGMRTSLRELFLASNSVRDLGAAALAAMLAGAAELNASAPIPSVPSRPKANPDEPNACPSASSRPRGAHGVAESGPCVPYQPAPAAAALAGGDCTCRVGECACGASGEVPCGEGLGGGRGAGGASSGAGKEREALPRHPAPGLSRVDLSRNRMSAIGLRSVSAALHAAALAPAHARPALRELVLWPLLDPREGSFARGEPAPPDDSWPTPRAVVAEVLGAQAALGACFSPPAVSRPAC